MSNDCVTFVCYKWQGTDPQRQFRSEHVNVLRAMLARNYHAPHRLVCITEDAARLDPRIEVLPMPVTKADRLISPHTTGGKLFPSCYRRLWLFSAEAAALLPGRIVLIDIDVVILGDITRLIQEKTADFVGWSSPTFGWCKIAGGFWAHTTGTHTDVWDQFDPVTSPKVAFARGYRGSDQAWLSYMLHPAQESWSEKDGIIKINWLQKAGQTPPPGIKMVFTSGLIGPWNFHLQLGYRWVREHWCIKEGEAV